MEPSWVISTNAARCRDCYRCVRACPVKAVRVKEGQAQVVPELCIACGSCVWVCPQKAKNVRDDRGAVQAAIKQGRNVVATVAPSFPAFFNLTSFSPLKFSLQRLGFAAAEETAFGAKMVGVKHREFVEKNQDLWPILSSSCPGIVALIEKYYPDLLPHLAPIVSPMVAHARWLRQGHGKNSYVVFIGPCIAKKQEMLEGPVCGEVDAALTFQELLEWISSEAIGPLVEIASAEEAERANGRLFPVEGGLVSTAKMETDRVASRIVTATGIEACEDVLRTIRDGKLNASLVELNACEGSCINGPVMRSRRSAFLARQQVIEYAAHSQPYVLPPSSEWPRLERTYENKSVPLPEFNEQQIKETLKIVEKYTAEDELNCGACGYATCRDKAVATLRGMAEATMCIPYMRRRSESIRQVVMDVSPSAILIVDRDLRIQDLSPSAEKMFRCYRVGVAGEPLSSIFSRIDGFAKVWDNGEPILSETVMLRDDLVVEQTIVPVKDQRLLVGILRDVTDRQRQQDQLERMRNETVNRSQEVIKNQMRVAQEIAQLLGETTAETKMMLTRLVKLLEDEHHETDR